MAPPAVTVSRVKPADFVETVLVTGSLVPREDVLVAPEVEGLRVLELRADEGDEVKKGDILAVLETTTLDAQLAQNAASLDRSKAAIAQAKSQITEVQARLTEAAAQLERAKPLSKEGYLSESTLDARTASKRSLEALLAAAQSGLTAAEAEQAQLEAARRELEWRHSRTDVRAPVDGIISKRTARIGSIATAVGVAAGEPMFRIIQNGEIELDAEVGEQHIRKLQPGQTVLITIADGTTSNGKGAPRLPAGGQHHPPRSGPRLHRSRQASARWNICQRRDRNRPRARPRRSRLRVSTSGQTSTALILDGDTVQERPIELGLSSGGLVEVRKGLADGDRVIARAGTFLKSGDVVRPIETDTTRTVSKAQ